MCGIALICGPGASTTAFRQMLDALAPRGETEGISYADGLLAGTQRLRIVDREHAVQPWTSRDGRWLLCYNGEIFNYRALGDELRGAGRSLRTDGDTEVLLEAFLEWGERAVTRLRGEFAFAIADQRAGRVYLARDQLGVKPLYWSVSNGRLHVASEIKALVRIGAPIRSVPAGHHGWASAGSGPLLVPYTTLLSQADPPARIEDPDEAAILLRAALADSIAVRTDTDLTVGVILSGGLDSSITLLHVQAMHPDCVAITVGAPGSQDIACARRLTAEMAVRHEVIEIAPSQLGLDDVREAIRICELSEYGDIINAVACVPLYRRVRDLGIKVVLTGDGSDELFGGYPMYDRIGAAQQRRLFLHKLANLGRTELQRVDRASMGHRVETRVPFLDPELVKLAMRLPMTMKVRDGTEKWILRRAFAGQLPGYVARRPKNPLSHSSGLHERARLYKPLFARIHRSFGYDLHEPVHKDFSTVLARCGNDLDLARAAAVGDYSAREHARDLVGAARWNATALLRGRAR